MNSIIIAGSRTVSPTVEEIDKAIYDLDPSSLIWAPCDWQVVICGDAPGADRAGAAWAQARQKDVHHEPITKELVDLHGRYLAPKMRNRKMAERGDGCIVFWD